MATGFIPLTSCINRERFQSIGVTKEWRLLVLPSMTNEDLKGFPINRRHQRMATHYSIILSSFIFSWFPINRRHQRMATAFFKLSPSLRLMSFQSIGVTKEWRLKGSLVSQDGSCMFPINRRHQRMATEPSWNPLIEPVERFQSIGVTKEWRRSYRWL